MIEEDTQKIQRFRVKLFKNTRDSDETENEDIRLYSSRAGHGLLVLFAYNFGPSTTP